MQGVAGGRFSGEWLSRGWLNPGIFKAHGMQAMELCWAIFACLSLGELQKSASLIVTISNRKWLLMR